MALQPLTPVDTRALFRPVSASLVALLRELPAADRDRPTAAGSWVRARRRRSSHRHRAYRVFADPADLLQHLDEVGGRR